MRHFAKNEIAQSECCSGHHFVRLWMHAEHLLVDHKKMSKSLGNFYTLRDILKKGYTGPELRYLLLSTHYRDMMDFTEGLFERVAMELFGDTKVRLTSDSEATAQVIDLKAPWKRLSMKEAIKTYAHLDVDTMSVQQMKDRLLKESHIDPKGVAHAPRGALISMLFEEFAEKHLIQPHHIIDHPIETTPLCKPHRDPHLRKEGFVERFESFIRGREMCNPFSELNDPELQRDLLVQQAEKKEKGDLEANPLDEEFLEAICQGMPPTGGVGIGIDRLVMLFANAESIRDVLLFPIMRPED